MRGADIASQAVLALNQQNMRAFTSGSHGRRDSRWATPSYEHIILLFFHLIVGVGG